MERNVVVTGIGVISPVGSGKDKFWQSLIEGKSGIDRIKSFDPGDFDSQMAGEVKDFDPEDFLPRKEYRRMDRFSQFAVCASLMAMQDASISLENLIEREQGLF